MHMADALISPVVGGTLWAATAGVAAYAIKKVQEDLDDKKIPLMGVMGAFVFAAQMINFSIPGTGSSGHLGGGLLLAILLGPHAGFLAMASILLIQALFFADGGLLAFGCNVFNLGFYTCYIAYPLIFKWLNRNGLTAKRIFVGSMLAALIGLQMGSFSVVLETVFSGKTELPFTTFALVMQPIHLAISVVEGLVTSAIITFVWRVQPEILESTRVGKSLGKRSLKGVLAGMAIVTVLVGGVLSGYASSDPDGLEWSMEKTAGTAEIEAPKGIHAIVAAIQSKTALLPDYNFKKATGKQEQELATDDDEAKTAGNVGTSVSGLVGSALTLALAALSGTAISLIKRKKKSVTA